MKHSKAAKIEHKEHPWTTWKQAEKIVVDHEKAKKKH
jgi:hypothetical protein